MKQYRNVQNILISGKKCSVCEVWYASNDKKAWIFNGRVACKGWYKKGETIYKKYLADKQG